MKYKKTEVGVVPEHWDVVSIGEVGEVVGGGTPSTKNEEYYGGEIPWLTPKDLSNVTSKEISHGARNITKKGLENSSAKILPKDTILLSSRAPIGYVAIAANSIATSQGFKSIVCNSSKINPDYLYYKLKTSKEALESISNGSTFKEISGKVLKGFKIPLPPLNEQEFISKSLSALDKKIELNNQIIANLEELAQTLFKRWFINFEFPNYDGNPYQSSGGKMVKSELGLIPEGWNLTRLEKLIEFKNGYPFKSRDLLDEDIGDCLHVFKMGHIKKGGGFNKQGTKNYIEKDTCNSKLAKYLIKKGDLLICMTDMKSNVALLGHTALMDESDQYILNQRVGLLRIKNENIINYPYLYMLTNSSGFIENLRSRANSGVQVNLSTKEIKNSLVVVPPKNIHKKYDDISVAIFEKVFKLEQEKQTLASLRKTLLPKLLAGEIELSEKSEVQANATLQ